MLEFIFFFFSCFGAVLKLKIYACCICNVVRLNVVSISRSNSVLFVHPPLPPPLLLLFLGATISVYFFLSSYLGLYFTPCPLVPPCLFLSTTTYFSWCERCYVKFLSLCHFFYLVIEESVRDRECMSFLFTFFYKPERTLKKKHAKSKNQYWRT